jgi:hypothetical protein
VFCNKTKLPGFEDAKEIIRYASVTNGLNSNENLCSYDSKLTKCAKKMSLDHCTDQTYCNVRNGWFSLEPHCSGNSYFTELEYDCQPTFTMCEAESAVVSNVFSGLVLSPSYPLSFRSDRSMPCYLTINLPKNHHVEITIDYLNMVTTERCQADYIEISEYKKVEKIPPDTTNTVMHGHKRSQAYQQQSNEKEYFEEIFPFNKGEKRRRNVQHRPRRTASYRWQTVKTICSSSRPYRTFKATSHMINFKFRPLAANHTFVTNSKNAFSGPHKFKIFFQGIYHFSNILFNRIHKFETCE